MQLEKAQVKRVNNYVAAAYLISRWFMLTSKTPEIKPHEVEATIFISALSPILDDLQDLRLLSGAELEELVKSPEKHLSKPGLTGVAAKWMMACLSACKNKTEVHQAGVAAMAAQLKASKQNKVLGQAEQRQLAQEKGGKSILIYRQVLDRELSPEELELCEQIGLFIQLSNDLFDIGKDREEGIHTCYTEAFNLLETIEDFNALWSGLVEKAIATKPIQINPLVDDLAILFSRGFVAIHHYQALTKGASINPSEYSTSELIVDMEKLKNIKLWAKEFNRLRANS